MTADAVRMVSSTVPDAHLRMAQMEPRTGLLAPGLGNSCRANGGPSIKEQDGGPRLC